MQNFDQAFQEQLAAHYMRDDHFVQAAGSLVQPQYFEDPNLAALIAVQQGYLQRYGACCTPKTFVQILTREIAAKRARISDLNEAKRLLAIIYSDALTDGAFVTDTLVEFCRHQALVNSAMDFVDALDSADPTKIEKALVQVDDAKDVGATDTAKATDYRRGYTERAQDRARRANPLSTNAGISTGCDELDKQLTPHNGWGRKELSILMGPPKSGKTAGMIHFALAAAASGKKVFYASCEVSEAIIGDRSDSNVSGVALRDLAQRETEVEQAMIAWEQNLGPGELEVQAFPIRTLKVSELTRILKKFQGKGKHFDLIVVDYLGIMKPEEHHTEKRHGIAEIGQDLRAMATVFNAAVLTGFQTNREGTKKAARTVTDGTDAAEDYEAVRTADVLLTINRTEDDRDSGQMVLYFSEMRNAESGLKMRFTQDIRCMRFIIDFIGYD